MFRKIVTAAFAAALAIALSAPAVEAQKALVYCPVGIDASGCDRIVTALQTRFTDGVDRGYDGSNNTVDLKTVDLQHYGVFVVPSLADDATKQPYALLRAVASRLHFAINGRVAVYSGAPDQGNSNRFDKDALIQNLATWAANGHTRTTGVVGLVAFLDLSEQVGDRYSWVRGISLADVSADAELQAFSDVTPVSSRGGNVLSAGGRSVRFSNMASYGLHIGRHAAARTEVGALGGGSKSQSVLVMYSNADGKDNGTGGVATGQVGSTGASLDVTGVKASLSTTASTSSTATTSGPAITTDKPDYQPGDTVTFTGTGFAAGDTVTITVHEDPTWSYPDRQFVSVADGNGGFVNRQMLVDKQDLGVTFTATAVAVPSGLVAQTTFTDGKVQAVSVGAQTPAPITAGATATYTVTVQMNGNANACTVTLSVSGLPTGAVGSFNDNPAILPSGSGGTNFSRVLTVTTSPATPAGTSAIIVSAQDGAGCQDSNTSTQPATLAITAATATTSTVAAATATYGDASVVLSSTISPAVNAGTVVFAVKQGVTTIGSPTTSGTVSGGSASVTYVLPPGTGAGGYTIEATYSGGGGYAPSTSTGALTISKANQAVLTLSGVPATAAYQSSFTVTPGGGSSSSALVVTTTGVCTNVGNDVTMTSGTGSCTVHVNRAGDANYNDATEVTASATATKLPQSITGFTLSFTSKTVGDGDFSVTPGVAGGPSGNPVTYATDATSTGCTVTLAGLVSVVDPTNAPAICVLVAAQAGNANYLAATPVMQSFSINPNQAPIVGAISLSVGGVVTTDPIQKGTTIGLTSSFTDADVDQSKNYTVTVNWGDGSAITTQSDMTSPGAISGATHSYTTTGVFTVTVSVTDKVNTVATGTAIQTYMYAVIYDPNGGFVTGGGWIMSPLGAYVADPSLTGKANFGFVSKYQKGQSTPSGNTEFQFQAGNLNFKSVAYDWLVISGARAQYKGTGTINGKGNYGFLLTAIDGDVSGGGGQDMFRIKIWNIDNSGAIVYDNQIGASDTSDPITVLGGGSISIKSK
ncbi:MAG TPA: hypothetical protein VLN49_24550 [Gemmatimonadaceae bacterium]|nr:hypothetical protein [Gemmatimonadaceae bacterium]